MVRDPADGRVAVAGSLQPHVAQPDRGRFVLGTRLRRHEGYQVDRGDCSRRDGAEVDPVHHHGPHAPGPIDNVTGKVARTAPDGSRSTKAASPGGIHRCGSGLATVAATSIPSRRGWSRPSGRGSSPGRDLEQWGRSRRPAVAATPALPRDRRRSVRRRRWAGWRSATRAAGRRRIPLARTCGCECVDRPGPRSPVARTRPPPADPRAPVDETRIRSWIEAGLLEPVSIFRNDRDPSLTLVRARDLAWPPPGTPPRPT